MKMFLPVILNDENGHITLNYIYSYNILKDEINLRIC